MQNYVQKFGLKATRGGANINLPINRQVAAMMQWFSMPINLERPKAYSMPVGAAAWNDFEDVVTLYMGYCHRFWSIALQDLTLELLGSAELFFSGSDFLY